MSPTETAEPVEVLFGIWAQKGPRNHVLGGVVLWLKYCSCFCLHVNIAKRLQVALTFLHCVQTPVWHAITLMYIDQF